ncbi:MAG: hypothetical protein JSR77_03890 [Planctomycetes bacterium]|nr:hypothetical protein [Planctomycetota bacterium]
MKRLACTFLAIALCACSSDPRQGYSFESTFPKDVQTVIVPVFKNQTTTPGIESELTEAIIKEIQASTPMKVTSADPSDSRLAGVITDASMKHLTVRSGTGLIQELAYQITVDFDWSDSRRNEPLVSRRKFTATDTFSPATGVGERIEVGQHAAIARLAKDIVAEMRSSW